MLKKMLCICIVISIIELMIVGCTNTASKKAADGKSSSSSTVESSDNQNKKIYKYTLCMNNFGPWNENPEMVDYWEDYFKDVEFELVYVESNQRKDKINLMIASGDIPDVMHGVDGVQLQKQGVIGGWDESLLRQHAPDIAARIDRIDPSAWNLAKYDGKLMYTIPNFRANDMYANVVVWRDDWLRNIGINEIPQKLEDVEKAFYKLAKDDPDQNGKDDTYALSQTGLDSIYGAFGTMPKIWIENESGQLEYGSVKSGAKDALALISKWYKDGVLDPEFITGENQGGYWAITHSFINNKIGYTGMGQWYHWHPDFGEYGFNGRDTIEFKAANPNGSFAIGYPPIGPDGKRGTRQNDMRNLMTHFSKQLVDDTDRFVRLLQIINVINGSDVDMCATSAMGIKGKHWDYDIYNGNKVMKVLDPKLADPKEQNAIGAGMTFMFVNETGDLEFQKIRYGAPHYWAADFLKDKNFGYVNKIPVLLPSATKYKSELDKLLDEGYIAIITGDKPIDYFDEMVKKWKQDGGDQLTSEANEWYAKNK